VSTLFEAITRIYGFLYVYGKTAYYKPWMHWIGIVIRRKSYEEDRLTTQNVPHPSKFFRMVEIIRYALPLFVFFLRFLEWWYSREVQQQRKRIDPVPPPPPVPQVHQATFPTHGILGLIKVSNILFHR
jgi:peroxin-12